jgi:hypothetical protein
MWLQFRHLLGYSWENLVGRLGTTTLAVSIFSFALPLLIFIVLTAVRWREERAKGVTAKKIITGTLFSWVTIVPSLIYLITWFVLLAWSLGTTASIDHSGLLARIRQLNSKIEELNRELQKKPKEVVRVEKAMPTVSALTQNVNPQIRFFSVASRAQRPGTPIMEYALTTATLITPIEIMATCDFPIAEVRAGVLTPSGNAVQMESYDRKAANQVEIIITSPAWPPNVPLWVTIFFSGKVERMPSCSFGPG